MSTLFLILLIINLIALIIVFLIEKQLSIPHYTKQFLIALLSLIGFLYSNSYKQELKEEKQQFERQKTIYQKILNDSNKNTTNHTP